MHFVWLATLALILLYCERFSDHELFTELELGDARTLVWSKKDVSDKGTGLRGLVRARDELGKGGGPPTI